MKNIILFAVISIAAVGCAAQPDRYVDRSGATCKHVGYSFQDYWMNEKTSMLCDPPGGKAAFQWW